MHTLPFKDVETTVSYNMVVLDIIFYSKDTLGENRSSINANLPMCMASLLIGNKMTVKL